MLNWSASHVVPITVKGLQKCQQAHPAHRFQPIAAHLPVPAAQPGCDSPLRHQETAVADPATPGKTEFHFCQNNLHISEHMSISKQEQWPTSRLS